MRWCNVQKLAVMQCALQFPQVLSSCFSTPSVSWRKQIAALFFEFPRALHDYYSKWNPAPFSSPPLLALLPPSPALERCLRCWLRSELCFTHHLKYLFQETREHLSVCLLLVSYSVFNLNSQVSPICFRVSVAKFGLSPAQLSGSVSPNSSKYSNTACLIGNR